MRSIKPLHTTPTAPPEPAGLTSWLPLLTLTTLALTLFLSTLRAIIARMAQSNRIFIVSPGLPPPLWARRHWRQVLSLALVLLLFGAAWWLRSPLHHLPLERDEGAYAEIAKRWFAGAALYRDLFDHKPPFVYVIYGLAPLFADEPVVAVRTLATIYLMLVGAATAALAWRLYGKVATVSGLLLAIVYGSSLAFQGLTFNSEAIMALPATLACLLVVAGMQGRRYWPLALGGVGVGVAVAAKLVGVLLLPPLALAPLLLGWPRGQRLAALGLALAGVSLPWLIFAALLWQQDALPAAFEALVLYNSIYAQESVAIGWDPVWLWNIWAPMLPLLLPAIFGLLVTWRAGGKCSAAHAVTALWGLALLASALLSLRAYPHYYLATVPFCSIWAGAGIAWLGGHTRGIARAALALALLAALLALVVQPVQAVRELNGKIPHEQSGTLYGYDGWMFFGVADTVAGYVRQHVGPDQRIFVWAAEPEIYYLAERAPATRFVYYYPVERLPGGQEQLMNALRADPPPLIITYHDARPIGFDPFMPDHGYTLRITVAGYDIYERP